MRKLSSFTFISLDGYYKGPNEDISWHRHGAEEGKWSAENVKSGNTILFGRKTYKHMASFWPTTMAAEMFPEVAEGMNKAEKIVFSKTLTRAGWNNSRVINGDLADAVKTLKQNNARDMTILGSGEIVTQLAERGLIDEFSIMIDPVAIGKGTPLFQQISSQLQLQLVGTRTFKSGVVLINYEKV
jgi:dihydrofolate reductase